MYTFLPTMNKFNNSVCLKFWTFGGDADNESSFGLDSNFEAFMANEVIEMEEGLIEDR